MITAEETRELDREAWAFPRRCWPYAPETERPFVPATLRLAWACQDPRDVDWPFNPREVQELHALAETLHSVAARAPDRLAAPLPPEPLALTIATAAERGSGCELTPAEARELKSFLEQLLETVEDDQPSRP